MSWLWIIIGVMVLMLLSAVLPLLRRFFWGFTISVAVLLALHFRQNPEEAMAAYAGMGAFFVARRPLLRIIGL